jgi:hypothetical protein
LQTAGLPDLPALDELETRERAAFAAYMDSRDQGYPLARYDNPKVAAYRLVLREDSSEQVDAATRLGDRMARAEGRVTGRVVVGQVQNRCEDRTESGRRAYTFELVSTQRVLHLRQRDELSWADDPRLRVLVTDVQRQGERTRIVLRIVGGQRTVGMPTEGATLELIPKAPDWNWLYRTRGQMKKRLAQTPWTHRDDPLPPDGRGRPAPTDPLAAVEALQ